MRAEGLLTSVDRCSMLAGEALKTLFAVNLFLKISALVAILQLVPREYAAQEASILKETTYSGMCDASAAVILTDDLFVVADDEVIVMRVYSLSRGGMPLSTLRLDAFLQ